MPVNLDLMDAEVVRSGPARAANRLTRCGLAIGTGGNLSVRVDDLVITTPSGADLKEVTPEQMVVTDLDGRVVEETEYRPTSELLLHLEINRSTGALDRSALLGGAIQVAPHDTFRSPGADGCRRTRAERTHHSPQVALTAAQRGYSPISRR